MLKILEHNFMADDSNDIKLDNHNESFWSWAVLVNLKRIQDSSAYSAEVFSAHAQVICCNLVSTWAQC